MVVVYPAPAFLYGFGWSMVSLCATEFDCNMSFVLVPLIMYINSMKIYA